MTPKTKVLLAGGIIIFSSLLCLGGYYVYLSYLSPQKEGAPVRASKQPEYTSDTISFWNTRFDALTKEKVESLSSESGIIRITLKNSPISSEAASLLGIKKGTPSQTITMAILTGRAKSWNREAFILSHSDQELKVSFPSANKPRMWINRDGKWELVVSLLTNLVNSGKINQYLQPGDLIVATEASRSGSFFTAKDLIVIK